MIVYVVTTSEPDSEILAIFDSERKVDQFEEQWDIFNKQAGLKGQNLFVQESALYKEGVSEFMVRQIWLRHHQ